MLAKSTPHLLVVDDEETIQALCQRSLTSLGCEIQTASSGSEALSKLKVGLFDVVMTDIVMPGGLQGCELLEEIKHQDPRVDVIMMTGFPALDTALLALKGGAYDYLLKPFDQTSLRSIVSHCLEKRRLSEELLQEKRLRNDLEAAYLELQELERLKEAFLARVNHELRIPLAPAFLALNVITGFISDGKGREFCEMLRRRLTQLHDLIEDLLQFSETQ